MKRHNFKKLQIWEESMLLIKDTYLMTARFPDFEKFGLRSQLNRCVVSIPSNIAEGTSKKSTKHFVTFLEHSLGSAFEGETQLIVCFNLDYITKEKILDLESKINTIQRKISAFIDSLD